MSSSSFARPECGSLFVGGYNPSPVSTETREAISKHRGPPPQPLTVGEIERWIESVGALGAQAKTGLKSPVANRDITGSEISYDTQEAGTTDSTDAHEEKTGSGGVSWQLLDTRSKSDQYTPTHVRWLQDYTRQHCLGLGQNMNWKRVALEFNRKFKQSRSAEALWLKVGMLSKKADGSSGVAGDGVKRSTGDRK